MDNTVELLKKLTSTVGVSGEEENIVTLLKDILKKYGNVSVDSMNNVYCTFGQGYHFLLDAHLDEIGMIVTDITDDGFIKVNRCGGIDRRMLLGYEVSVWGKEEVKGIISTLPPHLQNADDEKKVPEFKDISIDVGMSKEKIKKIVSLGDKVTFKRNFTPLLNSQLSASCLDDRAGITSILLCLDRLKNLPCKVTVMFSSQEELGTRGAKIGAFSKGVDEFICVDVSFAYTPNCDKADCGEIGKGAMIGFSPILVVVTLHIFVISSLKLYFASTISILSASILFISSIFPTISSSVCDAFTISCEFSTTSCGSFSSYVKLSSDNPTIAFSGVLIS